MQKFETPYAETGFFSKIVIDYLQNAEQLRPFFQYPPATDAFSKAIADKSAEIIDRNKLVDTVIAQYGDLKVNDLVTGNIHALKKDKTFCVVTAHQLNIFTGPLYVVYKTLAAVSLCDRLQAGYPDFQFVPVFWLGSEDHDFTEIGHFHLFGKTYTWTDDQGGACGRFDPRSLQSIIEELKPVLGESENAKYLISLFEDAYLYSDSLSEATRKILNALFGRFGLVVVDGDDATFKSLCSDIIEDELKNRSAEKIVQQTISAFPYEAQAKPREINLFWLQDNFRERITWDATTQKYHIHNSDIVLSYAEMLYALKENITAFSPNVILRPLFQQKVLPSVAYIGGGGEVAYWLQLRTLFEHHQVNFPVVLLRNSFLLIDTGTQKKMDRLGLSPEELFMDVSVLINNYVKKHSVSSLDLSAEKQALDTIISGIVEKAIAVDRSLDKTVMAEKQNILNAILKLEAKLLKAEKSKMDAELLQFHSIKNKLFPLGGLQERHENFMSWYLTEGGAFFDRILAACDQPEHAFITLAG